MKRWSDFKFVLAVVVAFSMILPGMAFVSMGIDSSQVIQIEVSNDIFGQVIEDQLVLGDNTFAIHGDLDDRALYLNGAQMSLGEIVPWWVSSIELDGTLHMVMGDAAYRTFLSHYMVSLDGGENWEVIKTFEGYVRPHITYSNGDIYIMFERSYHTEGESLFKLVDGRFVQEKGNQQLSFAEVLDYRTTREYLAYDAARKNEVQGRPAITLDGAVRAETKDWAYIYVCNGEASDIEDLLEADANEMVTGGSSANHWSLCLFDDDTGPAEVRVADVGGGGYTSYTMAELGISDEPNLGDPDTYVTFLNWCLANYPGINIVWDNGGHGGGTGGAMFDETPVDDIDMVEITTLANDLMTTLGRPINITSWDLCIMMTQEWLYGYKPLTDYTVCSMDNIVGAGYNYVNLMNYLAAGVPTPEELAHEIASDYWTGEGAYISTINMNNWDYTFMPTFNQMAQELTHGSYISQINTAWSNAFQANSAPNRDVWEWMDNINSAIGDATIQTLSAQARDQVWTANYPGGLNDAVLVEYGSDASHHGLGDESATNSAWQIDIETMRDEMLSDSGVSNVIPTCTVTSPSEAEEVPMDGSFNIQGSASDSDGSVSRVEVKINKEWWQVASGTNSWSFSWDVASDVSYYGIGPYKIWARSFDGTDYSNYQCINVDVIESFGPAGTVELDQSRYLIEDTMTVTVKDGGLTGPDIDVELTSTSEPTGETLTLLATALEGKYEATIDISATDSFGVLWVAHGDTIIATYDDADDGSGPATVFDTAIVDGLVEPPSGLTVEWFGTTSGTALDEDFSSGIPGTWTVINGGTGTGAAETWTTANPGARIATAPITNPFAIVDSDELGSFDMDEQLITDNIDLSMALSATLEFDQYFNQFGTEIGDVDVQSSLTAGWVNVLSNSADSSNPDHQTIDITALAAGASDVQIRFWYYNANFEWYWMVDNVLVTYLGGGTTEDNKLEWTLSDDDGAGANDVVQYNIYRAPASGGPWTDLGNVPAGTTTYVDLGRGEFDGTNWWYIVRAQDDLGNEDTNTNAIPEIPTSNIAPSAPNTPSPFNGETGVSVDPTLSVNVADPNGDAMDVYFYDVSGPMLIGTNFDVPSGTTTNMLWSGLSATTTYNWYAIADDGEFTTQSSTWSFTTIDLTPPGPPTDLTVTWTGSAMGTILDEDFSGGIPATWTIIDGGTGGGAAETWTTDNPGGQTPSAPISNPFAIVDSDEAGSGSISDEQMITEVLGLSGATTVTLEFDQYFNFITGYGDEYGDVDVRSSNTGGSWVNVFRNYGADSPNPDNQIIDITSEAAGASDVQIRFYYYGGEWDYYWIVDNILITYEGGATTDDNELDWTLSADDGAGANDVDHYNIYRADNSGGPWTPIDTVLAGTDTYTDFDKGEFDGTNWWYIVRAEDIWGNEESNNNAVPEIGGLITFDIPILSTPGWNFVSFPLVASGSPDVILNDLGSDTTWDIVKWYDPTDTNNPWKTYRMGASTNDLLLVDNCMGLWVHITAPGDEILTVQGLAPTSTDIDLYPGWNLVSYPSATNEQAFDSLLGMGVNWVAVYDSVSPFIRDESNLNTITMSQGNAYWIHVDAFTVWTVGY